jgi:secondary thiamine-phosphate synthase enzyme
MPYYQKSLTIKTVGKSFHNITNRVQAIITESNINIGSCHLFLRHTSASLTIQENADPDVLEDLARFFSKLVPEGDFYIHSTEGYDDMPAHIRTVLTNSSEQIPIQRGRLLLGTWQAIYLWEHRDRSHQRELIINIMGE